jgi:mitochondrial fission protein ELM1
VKNLPIVIWQLTDKRRGHDRQSLGLSNAISKLTAAETHIVNLESFTLLNLLRHGFSTPQELPLPHLIIGAGHQCQNALIKAKKLAGGLSICLMKPSLPRAWFDLCIIPEHDKVSRRQNTIETKGVLNPVVSNIAPPSNNGVVLIGGPSRHHNWDANGLVSQIRTIIEDDSRTNWTIANSRRTPSGTANLIMNDPILKDKFFQVDDLPLNWIDQKIESCGRIWVTADSVSMIFEALSTKAKVGIIDVPAKRSDRINTIAPNLQKLGWVYHGDATPDTPRPNLNEANRCAMTILKRWPSLMTANSNSSLP